MVPNVIITGAAGDLGRAIAARFEKQRARIGLIDLPGGKLDRATDEVRNGVALPCDITDEQQVEDALNEFGQTPDIMVCNAGIGHFEPLMDIDWKDFQRVLNVNLTGAFICARAAARRMAERKSGCIINITSINNRGATGPNSAAYPASKAGLTALTELMAQEWGPHGIRVNAVAPGFIDAGLSAPFFENARFRELRANAVPTKRLGEAVDVANAVAFLASAEAAYINGQELFVDGGVTKSLLTQLPRA